MKVPDTRRLAALFFDFDHTLTDFGRWVNWTDARREILDLYARSGADTHDLPRRRGAFALMAALDEQIAERRSRAHADATRAAAFAILERYECEGATRARLLPGAAEALAHAGASGLELAIVSANAERAIRLTLERLGLDDRFRAIVARTPERRLKPAPDMHVEALRILDCPPAAGLAIGDSTNDICAALAAGMLAVGVVGGEGSAEDLFNLGACYVLADLGALPPLLALWADAARDG